MIKILLLSLMLLNPINQKECRVDIATYQGGLSLVTTDGNEWLMDGEDTDYVIGGEYVIIFNTFGTDSVYDDAIVDLIRLK